MTGQHRPLPPAVLARIDQQRAETADTVRRLAEEFRKHCTDEHQVIYVHAQLAQALFAQGIVTAADIAASAIIRILELEDANEKLHAEMAR